MAETLKLKTNVPVEGKLMGVDYAPTKNPEYEDQSKLYGDWDGLGKGRFYLHLSLIDQLKTAGVIKQTGLEEGHPVYKLLRKARVRILREELDGGKKRTTLTVLDTTPEDAGNDEGGDEPGDTPPPARTPAPRSNAPQAGDEAPQRATPSDRRAAAADAMRKKGNGGWRILEATYARAVAAAKASGFETEESIAASAATLLIQAAREGWWVIPEPRAKAPEAPAAPPPPPPPPPAPAVSGPPLDLEMEDEPGEGGQGVTESDDELPF